jgi:hypothetical protein
MKSSLLVIAFAVLSAPAFVAPASAGEGNGNPFPLTTNGINTTMIAGKVGSNQNPFPYTAAGQTTKWVAGKVGSNQNPFPYTTSSTTYSTGPDVNTGSARQMQAAHTATKGLAPAHPTVR